MTAASLDVPREAGIKSIEVGTRLLEALVSGRRPMALGELAHASGLTSSKAHRYLVSFLRVQLVEQDLQTRRYFLGPLAGRLGTAMGTQRNVREQLRKAQRQLRDRTGHTVLLSAWTAAGPVVISAEDGSTTVVATMRVGSALPLTSSAAGRVFAAFMDWSMVRPLALTELVRERKAGELAKLSLAEIGFEALLARIRARGFESCQGSLLRNINAVAAPFRNERAELVGVMAIIGDADILDVRYESPTVSALRESARHFQNLAG